MNSTHTVIFQASIPVKNIIFFWWKHDKIRLLHQTNQKKKTMLIY